MAIGVQGNAIKNQYPTQGPYQGGIPLYDMNGNKIITYGAGIPWTLQMGSAADGSDAKPVEVIGDFGGCTSSNRFNGINLDKSEAIDVREQNVVPGCPCQANICMNGGTCVDGSPPYCICPPGWRGASCEVVVTAPNPGIDSNY